MGAQVSLEIKIDAQSEKGTSRNTLDLKVKETMNQIGAKVLEEKEEWPLKISHTRGK